MNHYLTIVYKVKDNGRRLIFKYDHLPIVVRYEKVGKRQLQLPRTIDIQQRHARTITKMNFSDPVGIGQPKQHIIGRMRLRVHPHRIFPQ